MFSHIQSVDFENQSNPHAWFLVASELNEQATKLRERWGDSNITRKTIQEGSSESWDTSNRVIILLCGFALENVLKSFLIYENPDLIANGFLGNRLKTHSLARLARSSSLIPYKSQGMPTLQYFEEGLESWARYPCGLNWAQTGSQNRLTPKKWGNYQWLMGAYENRLKKILGKAWEGPHEFRGSYRIEGKWLG